MCQEIRRQMLGHFRQKTQDCPPQVGLFRDCCFVLAQSSGRAKISGPQGKALTSLAHKLERAVYYMLKRQTAFAMDTFLHGGGSRAGEPDPSLGTPGISLYRPLIGGVYLLTRGVLICVRPSHLTAMPRC